MALISDANMLTEVKTRLSITGTFHDALLLSYISDVKQYLKRAGVSSLIVSDDSSIGVISRGVSDLWNFGSGDGKFSELFYDMAIQLSLSDDSSEDNVVANIPYVTKLVLKADKWLNNTQYVRAEGVNIKNAEFVKADSVSAVAYEESGVDVVDESDGFLTFVCETVPDVDLTVNVMVFPIVKGDLG